MKTLVLILLLTACAIGQDSPSRLNARLGELGQRARELERAIFQFNLGIEPEARLLAGIAPAVSGNGEALAAEYAAALEDLSRLAGRYRELAAGQRALPAASKTGERTALPAPAPDGPGPAAPKGVKQINPSERMKRLDLGFAKPAADLRSLADALFTSGRYQDALQAYARLVAASVGGFETKHREALCLERIAWKERGAGERSASDERLRAAREKLAQLAQEASGTPWAEAAQFALYDIEWRLAFEALGPILSPDPESGR